MHLILLITTAAFFLQENTANGRPTNANEENEKSEEFKRALLEDPELFEGDIMLPHETGVGLRNGIVDEAYRWPGYPGSATIPYVIEGSLKEDAEIIKEAMKQFSDNTCVKFVERTNEEAYLLMFSFEGCSSYVGMQKPDHQPQVFRLLNICTNYIGIIVHELAHAIGLYHEQSRSDRDDYITVNLENVIEGKEYNFEKKEKGDILLLTDFDYDSIMMYGNYAFSKEPGVLKTMEAKNGQNITNSYEKKGLSAKDIERINKLYKCKE